MNTEPVKTHYRACHLCEAICGLEIRTQGDEILSIKGDKQDPFSQGYICPKGTALADIHNDPDRLRMPVKRVGDDWQEISWEEAIELAADGLVKAQNQHGDNSVAFYAGNPTVHNLDLMTHSGQLRKALRTRNHFSASSLDQLPMQLALYLMYGHQSLFPVPDIDRTDLMVIIGGNPMASNGSVMTVPNFPKRIKNLRSRGGKLVVIDPRRTETADVADQHHFIKPGKDIFLLMAIIRVLFTERLVQQRPLLNQVDGLDAVEDACRPYTLELAEQQTGIGADAIREMAISLATTQRSVLYGRMGVSVQVFGGLCQWAIQVINILIGALNSEGGTLACSPAFGHITKGSREAGHFNRFQSRVSQLPEFAGELPSVAIAEEIMTPGEGQLKALVTIAGNPVMSSTNSDELDQALSTLDFYVAFDCYINATTRHADVILPSTSPLEREHYDVAFLRLAVRNVARYNTRLFEPPQGALQDWEVFNVLTQAVCERKSLDYKPLPSPELLIAAGIERGLYGTDKNAEKSLTLEKIKANPHGIDLGPLQTDFESRINTENSQINAAPEVYIKDLQRVLASTKDQDELLLIGRRHVRSCNSWMLNYHRLVKGKPRWQLMMHPDDLAPRGLSDGDKVTVSSRVGSVTTEVLACDDMMPGVVSLPHGWGHPTERVRLGIATQQAGANCNRLTDDKLFDGISANAALNGVPVAVQKAG